MNVRLITIIVLAVVFSVLGAQHVSAQTTHCTQITSLPFAIATSGVYCVTKNLSTNGSGISIAASNVVVDLNGYTITQVSGTANTEAGIWGNFQKNVTVRNGTVRGFYMGISLYDYSPFTTSFGNVVEDMRVTGSTYIGIQSYGMGTIIRNNQIVKTGGSTYSGATGIARGIEVNGLGADVSNNTIVNTFGTGLAAGTAVNLDGDQGLAINNYIVDATTNGVSSSATGQCRDNIASDVPYKYPGCIDLGNNQ